MSARQFLLRAAALLAIAFFYLWPAVWNGGPFFFPDTRTYIRGADAAANKLLHWRTVWTAPDQEAAPAATAPDQALHNVGIARTRSLAEISRKGILLGRSPFYGLFLYLGIITGGFWLTMLVQAGSILLAVGLVLRVLGRPLWPGLAWLGLGLCVVPAAPMFACYLMPDLFAGIAVLLCALMLAAPQRFRRVDWVFGWLLLAAAVLFHDSCLLIVAGLLGLALAFSLVRRTWANWRGLCALLLALVAGFAGQSLVAWGARHASGKPPVRLPFLSARLVADGPGANYLRANCPQSHFVLCNYVQELPLNDAEILFSAQPGKSVFETAPYEERSALGHEQFRFFFAVFRYDPLGVVRSMVSGSARQLADFNLSSFTYDASMRDVMARTFPLPVFAGIRNSAAYRGTWPDSALSGWLLLCVLGSLAGLCWALVAPAAARRMDTPLRALVLWIVAGVVLNAAVCGAFSAVDPRYQARVIWLLPLAALLTLLRPATVAQDRG